MAFAIYLSVAFDFTMNHTELFPQSGIFFLTVFFFTGKI